MDKPATEGHVTPTPPPGQEAITAGKPTAPPSAVLGAPGYAWWLVLSLVGLDYFSTLAYLPSLAVRNVGVDFALVTALMVVIFTLFAVLPLYFYIAGRSPHGMGATGLLESHVRGWGGKLLLLLLLSFVATDFVVTRSLSAADASTHLIHNSYWKAQSGWMTQARESLRAALPSSLQGETANNVIDWWNEQVIVTVILSVLAFGLYFFLVRGFTRGFTYAAALIVGLFVLLNGVVIVSCLVYVAHHPEYLTHWTLFDEINKAPDPVNLVAAVVYNACATVPAQMFGLTALGLSGFELSMASIGLVRGRPGDDPMRPRGRIRNARKLLVAAALFMSLFVFASVFSVQFLVPTLALREGGPASNRALAYLAHGNRLERPSYDPALRHVKPDEEAANAEEDEDLTDPNAGASASAADVNPLFGPVFGTLFDVSTILILCLAGASVTISLRDLLPHYLSRYGMELYWVQRRGLLLHLFNAVILLAIFYFHASVSHQMSAYAASVYLLLASATLAAIVDMRSRWKRATLLPLLTAPLILLFVVFLLLAGLVVWHNPAGAAIALLFIILVLGAAGLSHWLRSRLLRYDGFTFADEESAIRWEQIRRLELQILVPHRPDGRTLADKEAELRARHPLGASAPILFVEVETGDASGFERYPLLRIAEQEGRSVIHVSRCNSIAHVLLYIALEFRAIGLPPEIHFELWGQDKLPAHVHALIRRAAPNPERQPRVVLA